MNTTDDLYKECKNCVHKKVDHYTPIANPDYDNDPKVLAGVCKKEECKCEKFEYEE